MHHRNVAIAALLGASLLSGTGASSSSPESAGRGNLVFLRCMVVQMGEVVHKVPAGEVWGLAASRNVVVLGQTIVLNGSEVLLSEGQYFVPRSAPCAVNVYSATPWLPKKETDAAIATLKKQVADHESKLSARLEALQQAHRKLDESRIEKLTMEFIKTQVRGEYEERIRKLEETVAAQAERIKQLTGRDGD